MTDSPPQGEASGHSWWLFLVSILALPLVALLLKLRGFRRTEKLLAGMSRRQAVSDDPERIRHLAGRTASAVRAAADKGPFRAQHLEQAITLWWMLGLRGIETSVRLGIYKGEQGSEAHAWVLLGDEVLIGDLAMLDREPIVDVTVNRT